MRKLPVTWGYAVVFAGFSGFLHYLQLASSELDTIAINVTKNEIPNSSNMSTFLAREVVVYRIGIVVTHTRLSNNSTASF